MKIFALALVSSVSAARVGVHETATGVKGPLKFTKVGGTSGVGGTTEYCLDVHGSIVKGAKVKAKKCHGGEDQLWMYDMNGEGRIQVGNGKFLCLTQSEKADEGNLGQMSLQPCEPNNKLQKWSFNNHPNKKTGQMRRLKNTGSGKCMGLRYATDYNGGKAVTEWSCGKAAGQALQMCNDMSKPGCQKSSLMEIVSQVEGVKGPLKFTKVGGTSGVGGTTEYCLDVHGSIKEGATIKAKSCHGGEDQLWMYDMNGEGRIQVGSGKFLCLTQREKAKEDNLDQLYLSACKPNEKLQKWSFSNHPNKKTGQMRRLKNTGSGKCMGLRYATDHNGGKAVTEWSCGKAVGQAMQMCNDMSKPGCQKSSLLEIGSAGVKGPLRFTKVGGTTGVGGTTTYCLDVHGSIVKGAKVKAKKCHGGEDQLWMYDMNGEGRIQVGSGKFLCLTQSEKADSDDLDQMSLQPCEPNNKLQKWSFNNHPDKKTGQMRRLKNTGSGKCMGLRYATDHNGGKAVTEWSCGKAVGQALQMCNDKSKPGC